MNGMWRWVAAYPRTTIYLAASTLAAAVLTVAETAGR